MNKGAIARILASMDLGSSVAEFDNLLESARVETSVFTDFLNDRVDLVPGTKGSGKSALYRMFVDFLGPTLLRQRKVVVAHGVQSTGDEVFQAFRDRFEKLTEGQFVDFWCIYLVSLAHEQFIKNPKYAEILEPAGKSVEEFRRACAAARIPEIKSARTLRDILEWVLNAIPRPRKLTYAAPEGGRLELELFPDPEEPAAEQTASGDAQMPRYVSEIKVALEKVLIESDLSLWLLVDRLDEVFPRRSLVETRALRGLLRALRLFTMDRLRVKVFLRDDILEQVTTGADGFAALTHVTARQADTLKWSEEAILTLIVKRLFANEALCTSLGVDRSQLEASREARREAFYKVFPKTVYSPPNQSPTLRWIYSHTKDGRGVVTPRDVIDLLTRAKQRQQDDYQADPIGETDTIITSGAIRYGLSELSKRKRDTLLKAEYPHLWPLMERLRGQKTEYSERAIRQLLGSDSRGLDDLVSVGLLEKSQKKGEARYRVPFLYRDGLELAQGSVE